MIAFLFVLAISARDDFSKFHRHLEGYFGPYENARFRVTSVTGNVKFNTEYAKLNDDAVIARNKETGEIRVFPNDPQSFAPLQEYDMKLIRDVTSRCMHLHEYEFAGDFDKRIQARGMKPSAASYLVAMNIKTKQTFGDSINIADFQNHQLYIRWCNEHPEEYQREKEEYKSLGFDVWDEKMFEWYVIHTHINPPQLYRQRCLMGHEPDECILKFSKLSQDPQDLLQKSMHNGFQSDYGSVELTNIEAMLLENGYKYPDNFCLTTRLDNKAYAAKFDLGNGNYIFSSEFSKIDLHGENFLDLGKHDCLR